MNEIWTADLMNGPDVGGRACHLAGIIDDHSRFLTGYQFVRRPDAVRFAGVLRAAITAHGIPAQLYTDNGSCFADSSLARTCAVLGIKLVHRQPGKPAGRGKIEKVFQTIQQQFLVEITGDKADPARHPVTGLAELNDLLDHWSARFTTSGRIQRPGSPRRPAMRRLAGLPAQTPRCCARRSAGARSGWSARPPPLSLRATPTPLTRSWSAGRWSWSSTRST